MIKRQQITLPTVSSLGQDCPPERVEPREGRVPGLHITESALSYLAHRKTISEQMKAAGEEFRRLYEAREIGPARAFDPAKKIVGGGKIRDPATVRAMVAMKK